MCIDRKYSRIIELYYHSLILFKTYLACLIERPSLKAFPYLSLTQKTWNSTNTHILFTYNDSDNDIVMMLKLSIRNVKQEFKLEHEALRLDTFWGQILLMSTFQCCVYRITRLSISAFQHFQYLLLDRAFRIDFLCTIHFTNCENITVLKKASLYSGLYWSSTPLQRETYRNDPAVFSQSCSQGSSTIHSLTS